MRPIAINGFKIIKVQTNRDQWGKRHRVYWINADGKECSAIMNRQRFIYGNFKTYAKELGEGGLTINGEFLKWDCMGNFPRKRDSELLYNLYLNGLVENF